MQRDFFKILGFLGLNFGFMGLELTAGWAGGIVKVIGIIFGGYEDE